MLGEMFLRGAAVQGLKLETLIRVFDWIHDNDDDGRRKEWRRKYKKFFLFLVLKFVVPKGVSYFIQHAIPNIDHVFVSIVC